MSPRSFATYKFYRRHPGRKILVSAAYAPPQACVDVGSTRVLFVTDNACSVFRLDQNTLLYSGCFQVAGAHYIEVWKSVDNGATWTQKSSFKHPTRTDEMMNAGICLLGDTLFQFFEDHSGTPDTGVNWHSSTDDGETWSGYDINHRIVGIAWTFGNSSFYVTPWDGGGSGQDHKNITGAATQEILVGGTKKTANVVRFWKCTWNGTTWAVQYTSWNYLYNQPNKITVLTDEDNIYAGIGSENTSPYCFLGKLAKTSINGGTITITSWAGPPAGAQGGAGCSVPTLWSEDGNAKVSMHQGITTQNTLNFTSRKTLDQAASWGSDQTYPVLLCGAKKLSTNARPASLPLVGTELDFAFAEYVNVYAWFERV